MIIQAPETLENIGQNANIVVLPTPGRKPAQPKAKKEPVWPLELTQGGTVVRVFRTVLKTGYEFFTVAYYQDGKRKREVIKDEVDARARARKVLESLADGQVDAASMRLQDVQAYENAKRLLEPTGVTLETACREYAQCFALLNGVSLLTAVKDYLERQAQIVAIKTVREVVDELLLAKEQGQPTRPGGKAVKVSDRYLTQLTLRLDKFEQAVNGPISEVKAAAVNAFAAGLRDPDGKAVSGRTRNNYLESVRVLFSYAQFKKYVAKDCDVLSQTTSWAEDDFQIEIYTPEEMIKLLAAASDMLKPVLAIGAFAGLRYAEIARLDWSEMKLDSKLIEVKARKAKTRARRLVPISDNLASWLKEFKKEAGPVWPRSELYMSECQCECAKDAGLVWKHNALRHSFISYRVAEIKNVHQAALEAGNSPDIIFQHYRELVTEKQAKEWFGIKPTQTQKPRPEAES